MSLFFVKLIEIAELLKNLFNFVHFLTFRCRLDLEVNFFASSTGPVNNFV